MDPRGQALSRHASHMLQFKGGTDVALLNAMMHVDRREGLHERKLHRRFHRGLREIKDHVQEFPPEKMAESAASMRNRSVTSRANTRRAEKHHFLGHGHFPARARHRQCALPDLLALMTGHVGRPGTGPASAARPEQRTGRIRCRADPDVFPDYLAGGCRDTPQFREILGHRARPRTG